MCIYIYIHGIPQPGSIYIYILINIFIENVEMLSISTRDLPPSVLCIHAVATLGFAKSMVTGPILVGRLEDSNPFRAGIFDFYIHFFLRHSIFDGG